MEDLYQQGRQYFEKFIAELNIYNIRIDPRIEVREGKNFLPYYDLKDGNIYLPYMDVNSPIGKLQMIFMRSLLSVETNEELLDFIHAILPWLIAHELGHHLRQHYGLFSQNLWQEEQIANYLALALTKHRMSAEQRNRLQQFLRKAIDGLAEKMQSENVATVSYSSVVHALQASGQIDQTTVHNMEMIQKLFSLNMENMLLSSGQLSGELVDTLHRREAVIGSINAEYTSDIARYMYYHLGWMYLGVTSRERYYIEEFAQTYLDYEIALLPRIKSDVVPTENQILACNQASVETASLSQAGSQYFYKRYRELLVTRLQSVIKRQGLNDEAVFLLENWSYGDFDTLNYLTEIVPEELRYLLPNMIADNPSRSSNLYNELPTETDKRLWRHVMLNITDESASNTLSRLEILDKTDVYRVLSAEIAIEVIHSIRRVKLEIGEMLIQQGDNNNDVFILVEGRLGVFTDESKAHERRTRSEVEDKIATQYINIIKPGQVIGEVAFFTRETRNATVKALQPSVCYVLKASDLQLFIYNDPAVLMQMAGALAHRLTEMLRKQY